MDITGLKNIDNTLTTMFDAIGSHREDAEREGLTDLSQFDLAQMCMEDAQRCVKEIIKIADGDGAP
jgi:hypothetical protein